MVIKVSSNKKGSLVSVRLHQKACTQVKELIKMYPQHSRASIYKHAKKKLSAEPPQDCWHFDNRRLPKISVRDYQQLNETARH